ncbi:MAG TPA: HAD hydrolase-like protein [Thermoleophilia bacterium]|nr:HAD hydrolase-like protein [Thermoleophilia bacterium]
MRREDVVDQDRRDLVMFDFDGVIVDSLDVFGAAFLDACAATGVEGFTRTDDLLAVMESNFFTGMRARGIDDERVAEVLRRVGDALIRARHWLKPFPLVPDVLEDLADTRTVVVVTSSPGEVVAGWLRTHQVHGVTEVAGAESAQSKVEKIHALLARFPGQEVYWYVGDTAGDIREAREAGVTPLGVAWGWHEPEMLLEAGAERIVASPAELLAVVAPEQARDFFGAG